MASLKKLPGGCPFPKAQSFSKRCDFGCLNTSLADLGSVENKVTVVSEAITKRGQVLTSGWKG
jgi:hypothetical protein